MPSSHHDMAMIKCKHNIEITGPENKYTWNFYGTVDTLDLLMTCLTFLVLVTTLCSEI